jgi:hypothetical protein
MHRLVMLLLAAGATTALVAAGCGGDDDDDGTTAATTATTGATGAAGGGALSKEAFITAADGVCAQGDKQINKEAGKVFQGNQEPSKQEQDRFVTDTVLPNIQNQVDGIRALTPPDGDEDQVTAIVDAAQRAIDEAEKDPGILTQGGGPDPFAEANKLAEDYGLQKCGGD